MAKQSLNDDNQTTEEQDSVKKNIARSGKAVPLSARISQEDAEFLSSLQIQGANSPSEKLRVIIAETRKRHEGMQDYRSSLMMYQDMINRFITVTRELEKEYQVHSEPVSRLAEWLPDIMAFVTTMGLELQQSGNVETLIKMEDGITDRSFRLIQSILQMGVTDICCCYESDAISKRMDSVVKLIDIIQK